MSSDQTAELASLGWQISHHDTHGHVSSIQCDWCDELETVSGVGGTRWQHASMHHTIGVPTTPPPYLLSPASPLSFCLSIHHSFLLHCVLPSPSPPFHPSINPPFSFQFTPALSVSSSKPSGHYIWADVRFKCWSVEERARSLWSSPVHRANLVMHTTYYMSLYCLARWPIHSFMTFSYESPSLNKVFKRENVQYAHPMSLRFSTRAYQSRKE